MEMYDESFDQATFCAVLLGQFIVEKMYSYNLSTHVKTREYVWHGGIKINN